MITSIFRVVASGELEPYKTGNVGQSQNRQLRLHQKVLILLLKLAQECYTIRTRNRCPIQNRHGYLDVSNPVCFSTLFDDVICERRQKSFIVLKLFIYLH